MSPARAYKEDNTNVTSVSSPRTLSRNSYCTTSCTGNRKPVPNTTPASTAASRSRRKSSRTTSKLTSTKGPSSARFVSLGKPYRLLLKYFLLLKRTLTYCTILQLFQKRCARKAYFQGTRLKRTSGVKLRTLPCPVQLIKTPHQTHGSSQGAY